MKNSVEKGKKGELIASDYLKSEGFRVLHTNWRYGKLEIDIIAENNGCIHFVEVKMRNSLGIEEATKAVSISKQRNLIEAANAYLKTLEGDPNISFDIIAIQRSGGETLISFIQDAFYPSIS